jgi:hypothetical protein
MYFWEPTYHLEPMTTLKIAQTNKIVIREGKNINLLLQSKLPNENHILG